MRDREYLSSLFDDKPSKWTGGVERREPSTYRRPSTVAIRRCVNVFCREWISKEFRDCPNCGTIQPAA